MTASLILKLSSTIEWIQFMALNLLI